MRGLLTLLLLGASWAEVHLWTDEKGVTHMSSKPPPGKARKARTVKAGPAAAFVPAKAAPASVSRPASAPAPAPAAPEVELFTTSWCGVCKQARQYLDSRGVAYRDRDIEADPEAAARFRAYGARGVPLALIGGQRVMGFSAERYDQLLGAR